MNRKKAVPILLKAGDIRVKINGQPPKVDCRLIAEENYQGLIASQRLSRERVKEVLQKHKVDLKKRIPSILSNDIVIHKEDIDEILTDLCEGEDNKEPIITKGNFIIWAEFIQKIFQEKGLQNYAELSIAYDFWKDRIKLKEQGEEQPTDDEIKKLKDDRDCAIQAFQDTLAELNKLKESLNESKEKVSDGDIEEWAKHKVRNLHEVFSAELMWEDLLIIGAQAMQDGLIPAKEIIKSDKK